MYASLQSPLFAHKVFVMKQKAPWLVVSCCDVASNIVVATILKTHTTIPFHNLRMVHLKSVFTQSALVFGELETNHAFWTNIKD